MLIVDPQSVHLTTLYEAEEVQTVYLDLKRNKCVLLVYMACL
jgi:hypothetical protein